MSITLPRRFCGSVLLLMLVLLGARPAQASHLLGGELSYSYLDANGPAAAPFRYSLVVTLYINRLQGTPGQPFTNMPVAIYNRTTGAKLNMTMVNYPSLAGTDINLLNPTNSPTIAPPVPAGCAVSGPSQPFLIQKFIGTVNLPVSFDGYYAIVMPNARNEDIDNLVTGPGNNQPLTLYVSMAPPLITNRSPVFSDTAVAIVCQNDTTISLNNAVDPDGDRLVYSFGRPYGSFTTSGTQFPVTFPPLPNPVTYKNGFSLPNPLGTGAGNFALLNANTGIAKYGATTLGKYVVAVDVSEYRTINGREVLIGTTRRDLQLVVSYCPPTPPPVLPPSVGTPRSYTIEEGQSLSIPITATQATPNHPLVLTLNSVLLDGSGPFNTTFNGSTGTVVPGNITGTATATGNNSVSGTFVFNSACGNGRATPYDLAVTVKDNGCGGKLASDIFRITVNRAAGPNAIAGPTAVCDPATARTYTASGPVPASYRWRVLGGTINSGQGTNTVNVTWASANSTGTLILKGVSTYGCLSDSVVKTVDIRPLQALSVSATAATICQGTSTTLSVTGPTGLTYTWTGGSQPLTGSSITVSPTANTTYTVTGTDGTCTVSSTVTVNVTAPPVAAPGPAISICPGQAPVTIGTAAVAGVTYSWSPAIGLSSTTVAQPTVTATNTGSTPIVRTYRLTASTAANCLSVDSVRVTINPAALANAGPARTTCSGVTSAPIGSAGLAGYTYSWAPATGLNSATTAQPTVTLPNTTGAAITQTYTVTATNPQGCTVTSTVVVTVTPVAVAATGPAISFCSGATSAPLGGTATPVAGTTYSWSPTTGLSNPNILNPTVTGTNTTGAPVTTTYTLTATTTDGCTAIGTVAVTINPAAIANAGAAVAFCSGDSRTLGGGTAVAGTAYSWAPTTGLSNPNSLNPTVTGTNTTGTPITTTYTLTATTGPGCSATSTVVVTINPAAVASTGPNVSFCSGVSLVQLGGTATPMAGTTYSWSPTTGLSNPNILNPTVTGTNTTGTPITTTYTLTATTANGCSATGTVTVTINPAAVADAGAARSTCSNVAVAIGNGTAVAGTTYAWTPTTGLSNPAILNPTVTLPNLGTANITQTYTLTATTANGCTANGTVTVTVFPAAVAQAGPAVAFCSGETRTLGSGTAVTGTTYSWSPATGLSSTSVLAPTITLTNTTGAPITTTYILTATTANGCSATSTVAVTVNQAAVAVAGPARTTCSNVGVTIGSGIAATGTTYAWTPTTGLSSATSLTPTLTLPNLTGAPITTTYTLTATTAQGCTANSTVAVTVNPAAVAQAGIDKATCSNVGVTIGTGTTVAGTTYAWTPATGLSSASTLTPTVTLPNLTGAAITQQYILLATTANGCFQRDTVVVTINPAAVAVAGANRSVCSGLTTTLGAAPVTGTTYSWSPATGLSSATVANPTFTLTNTTTAPNPVTFTLTATTANGCVATSTVTVTVNPAAVASAGPAVAVCDGKRVTLGTPALVGYTYSWSPATNLSSATAAQPTLTGVNTGTTPLTVTYTLTATTANGCVSTSPVVVTINPRPAAEAITGPASVCPTVTGIAYSVVNPAATAYTWLVNGGTIASGQGTPAITVNWGVASTGGYVKVFRLNAQGCSSDTTTLPIIINQRLQTVRPTGPGDVVAVAPLPRFVCQADGPYTYVSGAFAAGSSYSWQIIGGTQVSTLQNTVTVNWSPVTVPTLGKIVVTETSSPTGGVCRGVSDTLKVLINPSPRTTLAITAPVRVCQTNGPVTFGLPGGFTGSSYTFRLGSTTLAGTGNTRTLTPLPAPGTYTLTAQETTTAGCVGPLYTTQFTVSPTPGAPTISGSGFVCNVASPQQYSIANATVGSSYQWTVVGGTLTSGQGTSQVTVQFGATGPYTVSAAETSGTPALCVGAATTRTIVLDNPTVVLTTASVDLTSNARVILTLRAPASTNTPNQIQVLRRVAGSGTFASVGTVAASATTFTDNNAVDASGNSYEYRLDLTNGCGTLLSSPVSRTIRLVATATPGPGGRDQGSTALTWNAYQGFTVDKYEIYRRTDAGTPVLVTTVPAATLQATVPNTDPNSTATGVGFDQNFRVVAVSADATPLRSNSNETNVKFANDTKAYNVITPNRDGLNDVLVIDNIQLYPGNTFTVFNRWGREVYKTTNYQNNWGQDDNIAPGNYFYILTLPNGSSIKNWFEVVK